MPTEIRIAKSDLMFMENHFKMSMTKNEFAMMMLVIRNQEDIDLYIEVTINDNERHDNLLVTQRELDVMIYCSNITCILFRIVVDGVDRPLKMMLSEYMKFRSVSDEWVKRCWNGFAWSFTKQELAMILLRIKE